MDWKPIGLKYFKRHRDLKTATANTHRQKPKPNTTATQKQNFPKNAIAEKIWY